MTHALGFKDDLYGDYINPLTGVPLGQQNVYEIENDIYYIKT